MFTTSSLYCYIAAKIFICCRWWSSHKCLNGWIYLRWSLIKLLRSSIVHYKIIKYCYFSVAFILLSLERIAILHVNIDKTSKAYCLATLINTICYCNKQKVWLDYWSQSNENDKTGIFERCFLITNFYVLKLWLTLIKEFGGGILIEKSELCWSRGLLWLFKLCDKMWLTFCVASITMPTSFHQCLGVKPCFETKFCQKFPYKIYFSVVWKVVAQSTNFVIYCG